MIVAQPLRKELLAALEQVRDTNNFLLGNEVTELEEKIAAYCQVRFGVGVSSGTDALLVALMALDIKAGDEVITTPLSFFATVGVIVRLGASRLRKNSIYAQNAKGIFPAMPISKSSQDA